MRVGIDITNLSKVGAGISQYALPLIEGLIKKKKNWFFFLIGTFEINESISILLNLPNTRLIRIPYPGLPEKIIKPLFSFVFFPVRLLLLKTDLIYSPYYDIIIPPWKNYAVTVHDTCYWNKQNNYPTSISFFHRILFNYHLLFANKIFSVSKTSKGNILKMARAKKNQISIIPNILELDPRHTKNKMDSSEIIKVISSFEVENVNHSDETKIQDELKKIILKRVKDGKSHSLQKEKLFIYFGGIEYRKNIESIFEAFNELSIGDKKGTPIYVFLTGKKKSYDHHFQKIKYKPVFENNSKTFYIYTGRLPQAILKEFIKIVNGTLYPSLCEGFGRPVGESIMAGTLAIVKTNPLWEELFQKGFIQFQSRKEFRDVLELICYGKIRNGLNKSITRAKYEKVRSDIKDFHFLMKKYQRKYSTNRIVNIFLDEIEKMLKVA